MMSISSMKLLNRNSVIQKWMSFYHFTLPLLHMLSTNLQNKTKVKMSHNYFFSALHVYSSGKTSQLCMFSGLIIIYVCIASISIQVR